MAWIGLASSGICTWSWFHFPRGRRTKVCLGRRWEACVGRSAVRRCSSDFGSAAFAAWSRVEILGTNRRPVLRTALPA